MSEEQDTATENDSTDVTEEWQPETVHEEKASSQGWKPEHLYEGDPENWVDAKTFIVKGELMNRITTLGRKVGFLESENSKLGQLVAASDKATQRLLKKEVEKARRELKAQRREAMRDGEYDTVEDLDEQLDELKEADQEYQKAAAPSDDKTAPGTPTPIEAAWYTFVTTTPWAQDPDLNPKILAYANSLVQEDAAMPVGDFMEKVLDKGKELRGIKPRATPSGPDSGTRTKTPRKGGKFTAADLNEQQTAFGNEFKEDGIIESLDEYAEQLGKRGALDKQQRG